MSDIKPVVKTRITFETLDEDGNVLSKSGVAYKMNCPNSPVEIYTSYFEISTALQRHELIKYHNKMGMAYYQPTPSRTVLVPENNTTIPEQNT